VARYFLHQLYGALHIPDPDGDEFVDLADAEAEAFVCARQMVGDALVRGDRPNYGKIQICDSSGAVLKEVTFREAIGLWGH
jgi:hypothetical protein